MSRARFLGSFVAELPAPGLPEVAFAGRSNVGKSSAINRIAGEGGLARVSKSPGRTRALNLFEIDREWIAVDLPGYGYAKVGHAERESWKALVEGYLATRSTLRGVVVLVDSRIEPQPADTVLFSGLRDLDLPFVGVATKIDGMKRGKRAAALAALARVHGLEGLIGFSAEDGTGLSDLLRFIQDLRA